VPVFSADAKPLKKLKYFIEQQAADFFGKLVGLPQFCAEW
jgi:hypothetical protein